MTIGISARNVSNDDLYTQYALLDAQEKELKSKKESLRVDILNDMIKRGVEKNPTPMGSFTIAMLKKWQYSEKVEDMNEKLKTLKAKEEGTGVAKYHEEPSLRFTQIKI